MKHTKELSFTSYDGLDLSGTLEVPDGEIFGRALLIHGMTADREEWGLYTQLAEKLRNKGIASLRMDYRCHGKASNLSTTDLSLSGIVHDIEAGYSALTNSISGNMQTFLIGASFGAGVCAFWAMRNPNKANIIFLCYPVLDYLADFEKTCGDWREQLAKTNKINYVELSLGRGIINEASFFSGSISMIAPPIPIVIFHGNKDSDVPIEESRKYASLSSQITLIEVEGAEHGFVAPDDTEFEDPDSQRNYDIVFKQLIAYCEEVFENDAA